MIFTNPTRETVINTRLEQIHHRLANISSIEAKAAFVAGYGARGEFEPERDRLIKKADLLIDELKKISGSQVFRPH